MTRKQLKKFAEQIYQQELIHDNEASSKEEKAKAEQAIISLTNQIACLQGGLDALLEIDAIIASKLN